MTPRQCYHSLAARLAGNIAGYALRNMAHHAVAIDDWLTYDRCFATLAIGVENGWDKKDPTHRIHPRRSGWNHTHRGGRMGYSLHRGPEV